MISKGVNIMEKHNNEDKHYRNKNHNRNIIFVIIFIFLLEGFILISAFSQAGDRKSLQIIDRNDQVIYEINGEHLSEFDKYYFENTFGSLDIYRKKLIIKNEPFPFRPWLTAAAGLPLFLILLSAFAVKAYQSLFIAKLSNVDSAEKDPEAMECNVVSGYIRMFERLDIFAIGFIILLAIFLYWVIPSLFTYISKTSIEFIINYKWFFIVASAFAAGTILWIIYLRYLLASKTIESQKEISIKQIEFMAFEKRQLIDYSDTKRIEYLDSMNRSSNHEIEE